MITNIIRRRQPGLCGRKHLARFPEPGARRWKSVRLRIGGANLRLSPSTSPFGSNSLASLNIRGPAGLPAGQGDDVNNRMAPFPRNRSQARRRRRSDNLIFPRIPFQGGRYTRIPPSGDDIENKKFLTYTSSDDIFTDYVASPVTFSDPCEGFPRVEGCVFLFSGKLTQYL